MQAPAEELPAPPAPPAAPANRPWLTWTLMGICIAVFAGVGMRTGTPTWEILQRWGYAPAQRIWHGALWYLVTSVFVHLALWHLVFNLSWLWVLGRLLERAIGPLRLLALFLGGAVVSSAAELAAADSTGIGLSGVVCALFGFAWVAEPAHPAFAAVITRPTVLFFLGWLVLCVLATRLKILNVGNASHFAGLAFGAAAAWAFVVRPASMLPRLVVAALLVAAIAIPFWSPWSAPWVATRAYAAHMRGDYPAAIRWYLRSERLGEDPVWVLGNLSLAYRAAGDGIHCTATIERLRRLDPNASREVERRIQESSAAPAPEPSD
jgi:membrane associated rhomboid family serine protease